MTLTTKLKRVVYIEELPSIKSQDPLITWSCKVRRQIKYVIPQSLWSLNLVRGQEAHALSHKAL